MAKGIEGFLQPKILGNEVFDKDFKDFITVINVCSLVDILNTE